MRHDWLYYRVYVASLTEIRDLVERVVAPTMRRFVTELPGVQWFFLQYIDVLGLHLRLRIYAPLSSITACEAELDQAFTIALDNLRAKAGPPTGQVNRMVTKRLYEPEYEKFGGPQGVALAERIMQRGSEAALACARPDLRPLRTAIGAAHTDALIRRLPQKMHIPFLHQYAWYWSGRARIDTPWQPSLPALDHRDPAAIGRARRLRTFIDHVMDDPDTGPILSRYTTDFWHMVSTEGLPRRDYLTAFHHIHLMNNRLGIVPGEEMQIARLLWIERLTEHHNGIAG
ncbi:thiopeptide-type bacteriocin biosynthesis protein [Streptomyces sp. NPDC048419]|uniref:thiopeptide-type bacteriocin biosynthesis protein n=1 Tax=Streptomyces sp. NPDC048419 TaxID=3365547 RepID=UPI003721B943